MLKDLYEARVARLARALLVCAASLGLQLTAAAHPAVDAAEAAGEANAAMSLPELERIFWLCDHAASTRGVDASTAVDCVAITDELKKRRFGGDFERFLAWWREHKPAQHAQIELALSLADGELTADEDSLAVP